MDRPKELSDIFISSIVYHSEEIAGNYSFQWWKRSTKLSNNTRMSKLNVQFFSKDFLRDFSDGTVVKNPPANAGDARDLGMIPGLGRSPGEGNGNLLPVFLFGKFHGQRTLLGYSLCSHKGSNTTEHAIMQDLKKIFIWLYWVFQILKCDAVKMLHSICQQTWKTQQWPQDWKRSVYIPIPKKGNAKECPNYRTIVLISHASKVMLKILQARFQQYVNWEHPDVQTIRKGRGTRDQIANIHWIIGKAREFQKNIYFCSLTMLKPLCGSQQTVENSSRDGNTRPPYLPPEKPVCRTRSNS